jgi:hypothetical protein
LASEGDQGFHRLPVQLSIYFRDIAEQGEHPVIAIDRMGSWPAFMFDQHRDEGASATNQRHPVEQIGMMLRRPLSMNEPDISSGGSGAISATTPGGSRSRRKAAAVAGLPSRSFMR